MRGRERLVRVDAPHFCAGLVVGAGHVVAAAPILKWTLGKTPRQLWPYFRRRRWRLLEVAP
jgi:hypothetical protein